MRSLFLILLSSFLVVSTAARADKRVALVIGNGTYRHADQLTSPPRDSYWLAGRLKAVGFSVMIGTDLTNAEMAEQLHKFGTQARDADEALLFYAGQSIAVGKQNYLLPIDADIKSAADAARDGFNLDTVIRHEMAGAKTKLILLDASHPNSFAIAKAPDTPIQPGLAEISAKADELIAFADAPGQVTAAEDGQRGFFTGALIDNITKPHVEIQAALKAASAEVQKMTAKAQTPWISAHLSRPVSLNRTSEDTSGGGFSPGESSDDEAGQHTKGPRVTDDMIIDALRPRRLEPRSLHLGRESSNQLPDFPWPPPAPSTYYVLPDKLFADQRTIGQALDRIVSALDQTGYSDRSYFRTEAGVALVTRLERIERDGTSAQPHRWGIKDEDTADPADLAKFLRGLFFVQKGYYRLIVFIIQQNPFIPSKQPMSDKEASDLFDSGANALTPEASQQGLTDAHCTVLVYEFSSNGKTNQFLRQPPLTAKQHLDKTGILSLLAKTN